MTRAVLFIGGLAAAFLAIREVWKLAQPSMRETTDGRFSTPPVMATYQRRCRCNS